MKVNVRELGPLENSEVELGELTVFFGPPDTGKSYLMKRIYAELSLLDPVFLEALFGSITAMVDKVIEDEMNYALAKGEKEVRVEIDLLDLLKRARNEWLERYADVGKVELHPSLDILKEMKVKLSFSSVELEGTKIKVMLNVNKPNLGEVNKAIKKWVEVAREFLKRETGINSVKYIIYGRAPIRNVMEYTKFMMDILDGMYTQLFKRVLEEGYKMALEELPPSEKELFMKRARSEIYRVTASLSLLSPEVLLLLHLGTVENISGEFFGIRFKDGTYVKGDMRIPLSRSSAFANEINVLLSLTSKERNSLLLIEEPESQLHPIGQVLISIYLYQLAKENKVVITTHSPFVVSTIAMLDLLRGKRVGELLKAFGLQPIDDLGERGVKYYYFHQEGERSKVIEKEAEDMMMEGIASIDDVSKTLIKWFSALIEVEK